VEFITRLQMLIGHAHQGSGYSQYKSEDTDWKLGILFQLASV
jgi:hypothetical protein